MRFLIFAPLIMIVIYSSCQKDEFPGRGTIDSDGGTIISLDGKVKLNFQKNSVKSETDIRIANYHSYEYEMKIVDGNLIGDTYMILPRYLELSAPVNVEFNYSGYEGNFGNPENLGILNIGESEDAFVDVGETLNIPGKNALSSSIDHLSQIKIVEFQSEWTNFNFYWNMSVIKWYLENTNPESYLTESNIKSALALWENETSSFTFEETYDKNSANIIFNETGTSDIFHEYEQKYHCHDEPAGMITFDTWVGGFGDLVFGINDHVKIYFASEEIKKNNEPENISYMKKVITHLAGHSLGIFHPIKSTTSHPVMSHTLNPSEIWDESLDQWDKNALHRNYAIEQETVSQMQVETLVDNLEYPVALCLLNKKIYFTEAAAWYTTSGGKRALSVYDIDTRQITVLDYYIDAFDAMVAVGDKIYLSSWVGPTWGEDGLVTYFDLNLGQEFPFRNVDIATSDMCLDSDNNFYLLGSSDLPGSKSLYKFSANNYLYPEVMLNGLGRTMAITSKDNYLYYSDAIRIWKVEDSDSPVKSSFFLENFISGMAFSDTYMYYSDYFNNRIVRLNLQTKVAEVLVSGISYPNKMVIDRDNELLYVISQGTSINNFKDGKILKITNAN